MRQVLVALALFALSVPTLSGCIVAPGPRYRHNRGNCHQQCARWGHRRRCAQRCQVYRDGVCVSYRDVCERERFCTAYRTRCY